MKDLPCNTTNARYHFGKQICAFRDAQLTNLKYLSNSYTHDDTNTTQPFQSLACRGDGILTVRSSVARIIPALFLPQTRNAVPGSTERMKQRRNALLLETAVPRENPPADGSVRYSACMQISGFSHSGIDSGSSCWEATGYITALRCQFIRLEWGVGKPLREKTTPSAAPRNRTDDLSSANQTRYRMTKHTRLYKRRRQSVGHLSSCSGSLTAQGATATDRLRAPLTRDDNARGEDPPRVDPVRPSLRRRLDHPVQCINRVVNEIATARKCTCKVNTSANSSVNDDVRPVSHARRSDVIPPGIELETPRQVVVTLATLPPQTHTPLSTLASHQGEPGSITGRVTGFTPAGIVPDDAVGRRVFSRISSFSRPFIPASVLSGGSETNARGPASKQTPKSARALPHTRGRGVAERRTGFNTPPIHSGFSQVGIVPDDAAVRWVYPAPSFRVLLRTHLAFTLIGSRDLVCYALRLSGVVEGDPPRPPLLLERCAHGCLPHFWESRECRQRRDLLASQTSSRLLEFPIRLATTQECSGETGWRLSLPRRITRVGEYSRWRRKTLYILPQPSGQQYLMEVAWPSVREQIEVWTTTRDCGTTVGKVFVAKEGEPRENLSVTRNVHQSSPVRKPAMNPRGNLLAALPRGLPASHEISLTRAVCTVRFRPALAADGSRITELFQFRRTQLSKAAAELKG
ncbi:hypothetical protein PR048_024835 [Dryococelus australis]|uniref:Uncharacterized protein n=1 Tax=Dryococelus australis TaxID=614101 RepID=A0ABQ9GPN8_9NEOP|nr:hypothetical protein PR048_024835 [Dryococelus australis]